MFLTLLCSCQFSAVTSAVVSGFIRTILRRTTMLKTHTHGMSDSADRGEQSSAAKFAAQLTSRS
jgi:hypothetical protein